MKIYVEKLRPHSEYWAYCERERTGLHWDKLSFSSKWPRSIALTIPVAL